VQASDGLFTVPTGLQACSDLGSNPKPFQCLCSATLPPGSVQAVELLPLFFRLFRCADKQLRVMIFRHIVADIKGANKNKRDDRLNRSVQSFLQNALKAWPASYGTHAPVS